MNALQSARIDHTQINVIDLTAAKQFYDGVLGRVELPRPESFDFPSLDLHLVRSATPAVRAIFVSGLRMCDRQLDRRWPPHLTAESSSRGRASWYSTSDRSAIRVDRVGIETSGSAGATAAIASIALFHRHRMGRMDEMPSVRCRVLSRGGWPIPSIHFKLRNTPRRGLILKGFLSWQSQQRRTALNRAEEAKGVHNRARKRLGQRRAVPRRLAVALPRQHAKAPPRRLARALPGPPRSAPRQRRAPRRGRWPQLGKSASTAARAASKRTVAQAPSKQRRGAMGGARSAGKVAAASKKSVARNAPSSRKGSSAKSASKPVNQRRRSRTVVARNEVAANPVTQAMAVTAEVTAGAIEATGKVAAAAADTAKRAAETLTAVATGAAPDQGAKDEEEGGGRA